MRMRCDWHSLSSKKSSKEEASLASWLKGFLGGGSTPTAGKAVEKHRSMKSTDLDQGRGAAESCSVYAVCPWAHGAGTASQQVARAGSEWAGEGFELLGCPFKSAVSPPSCFKCVMHLNSSSCISLRCPFRLPASCR